MNRPLHHPAAMLALFTVFSFFSFGQNKPAGSIPAPEFTHKIQAAILLDVSNSMDGLIEQAKAQLWNMVNVLGKVKCENGLPKIEIALYEYGRNTNDPDKGYIKQISPFTRDLDKLSVKLHGLITSGGDEFCGQVIHTCLQELDWDAGSSSYKVIFIAGNESFLQGNLHYATACADAGKKGVIVNTIFCGSETMAIKDKWNLGAQCGNGSFTTINQDAKDRQIATPFDSLLLELNQLLGKSYIRYGKRGEERLDAFRQADTAATFDPKDINKVVAWTVVRSDQRLYDITGWDIIDAFEKNAAIIDTVDVNTLPDTLKTKSRSELRSILSHKLTERVAMRKQIASSNNQRDAYILAEKSKLAGDEARTLKTEIEKIIREQVKRFNMYIE